MRTYRFEAGVAVINGVPADCPVTVTIPGYADTGLIHGGTWNARGRERSIGKDRADALVRALRVKRRLRRR